MGRMSKEEEARRNLKIVQMIEEGYDHKQIGRAIGMRAQNVLASKAWKIAHGEWEGDADLLIVTPQAQRNMLEDVTARAMEDVDKISDIIDILERDPALVSNNAAEIRRLYSLKKEYYVEIANMWAIAQTIAGGASGPKTTTGDKTQVNIGKIDYKKVHEAGKKATEILDKARLDGLIREDA